MHDSYTELLITVCNLFMSVAVRESELLAANT